jgi:predicted nucleic acid-binding protein
MPDPHREQPGPRVPRELKAAAQEALKEQPDRPDPWTFNDIVVAAVAEYVKRPRTREKQLEPFKPPRKRGRPPIER